MPIRSLKQLVDDHDGSDTQQHLFVIVGLIEFNHFMKAVRYAVANIEENSLLEEVMCEIMAKAFSEVMTGERPSSAAVQSVPESPVFDAEPFATMTLDEKDRQYTIQLLTHFNWNKSKTANVFDIERSTLDRKLARWGVSRPN